jgi:hypothetical protein
VICVAPLSLRDWFGFNYEDVDAGVATRASTYPTDLARFSAAKVQQLSELGFKRAERFFGDGLTTWAHRVTGEEQVGPLAPEGEPTISLLARLYDAGTA